PGPASASPRENSQYWSGLQSLESWQTSPGVAHFWNEHTSPALQQTSPQASAGAQHKLPAQTPPSPQGSPFWQGAPWSTNIAPRRTTPPPRPPPARPRGGGRRGGGGRGGRRRGAGGRRTLPGQRGQQRRGGRGRQKARVSFAWAHGAPGGGGAGRGTRYASLF